MAGVGDNASRKIPLSVFDPSWATRDGRHMHAIVTQTRQRFPDAPKGSNERKLKGGLTMSLHSIMPPTNLVRSSSSTGILSVASEPGTIKAGGIKFPELSTSLRSAESGRFGFRPNFQLSRNALQLDSAKGDTEEWFTDLNERRRLRAERKKAANEARRVANSPYSRKQRFVGEPASLEEALTSYEAKQRFAREEDDADVR